MRLVLDIQSLQSDSRCAALVATRVQSSRLAAANPQLELVLLLNGSYGDDSQPLMEELLTSIRGAVNTGASNKSTATTGSAAIGAGLECVQCYLPTPTGATTHPIWCGSSAELLRGLYQGA